MKRIVCLFLVFVMFGGFSAVAEEYDYDVFIHLYSEAVLFINQNTGRHLLPLVFSTVSSASDKSEYTLSGDMLNCKLKLSMPGKKIESCNISLYAPEMAYGDSIYNDFVTAGYHSYALLMAMAEGEEMIERYELVTSVNNGLAENDGFFSAEINGYILSARRENNTVFIEFSNPEAESIIDDNHLSDEAEGDAIAG